VFATELAMTKIGMQRNYGFFLEVEDIPIIVAIAKSHTILFIDSFAAKV
jgi:hypothetical protein